MGLVGLEHVAAAKRTENTKDREEDRQHLAARQAAFHEALGHIVHGTARHAAVFVLVAVLNAERTLRELRGHAHQAGQDHPEGRARSANAHGDRDARDIAETDSARKRRRQRLEVRHLASIVRVGVVALDQRDGMPEGPELNEAEIEREDRRGDDQPGHDPREGSAGEGTEDEIDEPTRRARENLVHLFIDGLRHRGTARPRAGEDGERRQFL